MSRIVLLSLAVLTMQMSPTFASDVVMGLDISKIAPLKKVEFLPTDQFNKATRIESEPAPYDDAYLPYELRIPKAWTENVHGGVGEIKRTDRALSDSVLAILGRYTSPAKNLVRSYVVVEAASLSYEVGLRDWFLNFILQNGFSLAAYEQKSEKEIEALYVQMIGDQAYSVRVRAIVNGPRIVMVRYYLPQDNIETERQQQAQVVSSFKLMKPSDDKIEKRLEYAFLDQSFFNYPQSWTLQARTIYSIERMHASIFKKIGEKEKESLFGQIKVTAVSRLLKTSLADEVKTFKAETAVKGYHLGKLIETISYKYDPSIKSGRTEAYEFVPQDKATMKNYEYVVSVLQNEDFYYFINLITPAREQDFYIWSRNMEAFRIVSETVRRSKLNAADMSDPYYDYLKE